MRYRTAAVLFLGVFNALWLAHVFVVLYFQGYYSIRESVPWIAGGELVLCLLVAAMGIERLARMKER